MTYNTPSVTCLIDHSRPGGIQIVDTTLGPVTSTSLQVKFLAAPINLLDLAVLDDVYPVKPFSHAQGKPIPGYDGLAEVVQVGDSATNFKPGDWVIPSRHGLGTWRLQAVLDYRMVTKIDKPIDVSFAAILKGSVLPAYLLVEGMAVLQPGDWIVQNAGTSVIAQFVAQFAKLRGLHTMSIVRDRPTEELAAIREALSISGVDRVMTESEFTYDAGAVQAALGIDAVFGEQGRAIMNAIQTGGTYAQLAFLGGTEGHIEIGATDLWAKGLTMKGFRAAAQLARLTEADRQLLLARLVQLFNAGDVRMPSGVLGLQQIEWVPNSHGEVEKNLVTALQAVRSSNVGAAVKHVLVMREFR